ncbi:MAG: hypothetical protein WAK26_18215 [Terracidiphilus sp.]
MALTEDQSQSPEATSCKDAHKKKRHRTLAQKWRLVSLPNKAMVVATIVMTGFTGVLAWVSYQQSCAMRKSNEITQELANLTMESEAPVVWAYNACLTEKKLAEGEKSPACTTPALIPTKSGIAYYAGVEFENTGRRQAVVTNEYVRWEVRDRKRGLPDTPDYNPPIGTKRGDYAIRPSGMTIQVERIYADGPRYFRQDEIDAIKENKSVLWIYGFIDMNIFLNRCQRIRFCYPSTAADGVACPSAYRIRTEPAEIQKNGQCPN